MVTELKRAKLQPNPTTISSHTQRKLLVLVVHYARGSETFTYKKSERKMFEHDRRFVELELELEATHIEGVTT